MLYGKKFCSFLVVMFVFFAVISCGCGGGGGGGGNSERVPEDTLSNDVPTPDTAPDSPDITPEPDEPDEPVSNGDFWPDVNGTWKVDTASWDTGDNTVLPFSRSIPPVFDIEVKDIENYNTMHTTLRNVLTFVGDDVENSGDPYSSVIKLLFRNVTRINGEEIEFENMAVIFAGPEESFRYTGNNTYEYLYSAVDEEHAGSSYTISFPDENTIIIVNISTYHANSEMRAALKRIR